MSRKVEYTILTAFVGLAWAVTTIALPDFPGTQQGLLGFTIYVLMKLGVEVIGKPVLRALFPNKFKGLRTPPE